MDFSPGRRFATYLGKQDGFSKEPKFANPSFPKSSVFTVYFEVQEKKILLFGFFGCFYVSVFVLCFFLGGGLALNHATSTQGLLRGSCHMAQDSPGTSLYS